MGVEKLHRVVSGYRLADIGHDGFLLALVQSPPLYITRFPNMRLVPLDVALARETALVRAAFKLRMPDAVHVAAARLAGADAIVTNDRRWAERVKQPEMVLLDDYVFS